MIDYLKLATALNFYKQRGFKQVEAPWIISNTAMYITAPSRESVVHAEEFGPLVASGEQSFLQMVIRKDLQPGRYVACTPCFRNEPVIDELHHDYFMKVELFVNDVVDQWQLMKIICDAHEFFNTYTDSEVVKTDIGYDIMSKGIELGSYGIREHKLTGPWIYGTGCAEPRLSTVMRMKG